MVRRLVQAALLELVAASLACSGDPTGPAGGNIEVAIAVSNSDSMPGPALVVSLDHGPPRALLEPETRFTGIESGMHTVALESLPLNCAVAGPNPVSVGVTSGQTVQVHFAVTCSDPGTLVVITQTTTTNGARPESYGLTLDGKSGARVAANGRLAIVVGEGNHRVELTDVPASCALEPGALVEFSVAGGDTTEIRFEVSCPPPPPAGPPTITLTVATSGFFGGPIDTNGYGVLLDDVLVGRVSSNGTTRVTPIDPGSHRLGLADLESWCSYPGPQEVVVPDSGSVSARFLVHCFLPGVP
jgi:hypothetical protein